MISLSDYRNSMYLIITLDKSFKTVCHAMFIWTFLMKGSRSLHVQENITDYIHTNLMIKLSKCMFLNYPSYTASVWSWKRDMDESCMIKLPLAYAGPRASSIFLLMVIKWLNCNCSSFVHWALVVSKLFYCTILHFSHLCLLFQDKRIIPWHGTFYLKCDENVNDRWELL